MKAYLLILFCVMKRRKKIKLLPTIMKNVIGYFSITPKPKVTNFDDESIKFDLRVHGP